jgi:hypothetical protein
MVTPCIIPDSYLRPNMMNFAAKIKLSGCRIFSKVDLRKGYHQIPMHARDIAIITPFGLYEFLRMGFGLRNASNTFQKMMDRVTNGLPFIFVYLDDIIVGSPDLASHQQHLQLLFQRLREFGLVINGKKCEFILPGPQGVGGGRGASQEEGGHPGCRRCRICRLS